MEMEMEVLETERRDELGLALHAGLDSELARLVQAADTLTMAADRLREREVALEAGAGRREAELEAKLKAAEATIAELRAQAGAGRKTTAPGVSAMAAKLEAGESSLKQIDAALGSLSLEQRIAVKAQMMRDGLLG